MSRHWFNYKIANYNNCNNAIAQGANYHRLAGVEESATIIETIK